MNTKLLILCLTVVFILACSIAPLPSVVTVNPYKRPTLAQAVTRLQIVTDDAGAKMQEWGK